MNPVVEILDLSFTYEGEEHPVLNEVSLRIERGEFVVLTGPSGCGKSTLSYCINGIIPHLYLGQMVGEVKVLGRDTATLTISELSKKVAMVFQDPELQLFTTAVEDEVALSLENSGVERSEMKRRVGEALRATGLRDLELKSPISLSGGQKQRLAIAAALAMDPEVLILDEPTAYLDPSGSNSIFEVVSSLSKKGMTVVLVDHKMDRVMTVAQRIVVMEDGRILMDGKPEAVFSRVDELQKIGVKVPFTIDLAARLIKKGFNLPKMCLGEDDPARFFGALQLGVKNQPQSEQSDSMLHSDERNIIEIKDLSFSYKNGFKALKDISLTVKKGEFLGIIGRNGAGKTTLAFHLNGILKPQTGSVVVDGSETRKATVAELASRVQFLFQNPDHQIFCGTVQEEISFGPRNIGFTAREIESSVKYASEITGLGSCLSADPEKLSMGQRRRLGIASMLSMKPSILVLDEPTIGQDGKNLSRFMRLIRELNTQGITVLMISHDIPSVLEYATRIVIMNDGMITADVSPTELLKNPMMLLENGLQIPPFVEQLHYLHEKHGVTPQKFTSESVANSLTKLVVG